MATERWFDFLDALVTQMQGTSGYRAPSDFTTAGVPVFDGVLVGLHEENDPAYLIVGWSGDPDQPEAAGEGTQNVATVSPNRSKDDVGAIRCRAEASTGDFDDGAPKRVRDAAKAILASVEQLVRTNPTLGLSGQMQLALIESFTVSQWTGDGCTCAIDFTVTYRARI